MIELFKHDGRTYYLRGKWSLIHPRRHDIYSFVSLSGQIVTTFFIKQNRISVEANGRGDWRTFRDDHEVLDLLTAKLSEQYRDDEQWWVARP